MLSSPADVNSIYEEALENLRLRNMGEKGKVKNKPEKILTDAEKEMAAKDYYANVRTNVGNVWQGLFTVLNHRTGFASLGAF